MTTPSPTIALSNVNTELNYTSSSTISMNDTAVRTLAGVTGDRTTISMDQLRGKTNRKVLPYPLNTTNNVSINVSQIAGYVAGKSDITITVNSGAVIYSTSTSIPALSISGVSAGDTLVLVNNGTIVGCGGAGGRGGNSGANTGTAGSAGGPAISAGCSFPITNNGIIGGGGGGGAGGSSASSSWTSGGGGGGGAGYGSGGAAGSASQTPGGTGGTGTATAGGAGGTAGPYGSYAGRDGGGIGAAGTSMPSVSVAFMTLMVTLSSVAGGAAGVSIQRNGYSVPVSGPGSVYN